MSPNTNQLPQNEIILKQKRPKPDRPYELTTGKGRINLYASKGSYLYIDEANEKYRADGVNSYIGVDSRLHTLSTKDNNKIYLGKVDTQYYKYVGTTKHQMSAETMPANYMTYH